MTMQYQTHSPARVKRLLANQTGASASEELPRSLLSLHRAAAQTNYIRVELPSAQALRMRKLVHRGAQRPVMKIPSIKLNRAVHCESLLEGDFALLLDASPQVQNYAEQAMRLRYLDADQWRDHIPDFVVVMDGVLHIMEVKFLRDVNTEVANRTSLLQRILRPLGAHYHVVTEVTVRQGNMIQNAHSILRRARHKVSDLVALRVLSLLRKAEHLPLSSFGWSIAASNDSIAIAQLIMNGIARVDLLAPLCDTADVWSYENVATEEVPIWFPAASA